MNFHLLLRLFLGRFADIYVGESATFSDQFKAGNPNANRVAFKVESTNCDFPVLKLEQKFYTKMGKRVGIAEVFHFEEVLNNSYQVMIMQWLDMNMEQAFLLCKRQFSIKTILYCAIQLITRFETIHKCG